MEWEMTEQNYIENLIRIVPSKCDKKCDYEHKSIMCKLTCFSANCPHTALKEKSNDKGVERK